MAGGVVFFTQKADTTMGRRRGHTEEQILAALRHAESGTTVTEGCRAVGIREQTCYVWTRKYAGLGLSELRHLREENTPLKRLVADLSLDRHMLQEIVRNKLYGLGTGGHSPAGRKRPIRSVRAGSRGCCH
jgi:putative transposase